MSCIQKYYHFICLSWRCHVLQRPPAGLPRSLPLAAGAFLRACRHLCTSMFANRPDKTTAVRQTQNTNINKQTNPFTHLSPSKHCVHMQPDFKALTQPTVRCLCFPPAALFWFVLGAFLRSCLIINGWCQRVAGLSV